MYTPKHFEEARPEVLHALIRQHPLATLVTLSADGLLANHIPLYLRLREGAEPTLVGHVARSNPVWQVSDLSISALAIFQGAQHYISPQGYASKAVDGKVVPTWNYCVLHVQGPLQIHQDGLWIREHLEELTAQQEAGSARPWTVDEAPREFTDKLIQALVGISIPMQRLQGKWKLSQNQAVGNRESLVQALQTQGDEAAQSMAGLMQSHDPRNAR